MSDITTKQAARLIGDIGPVRVWQLIQEGKLKGKRVGTPSKSGRGGSVLWLIDATSLKVFLKARAAS